MPLLKRATNLQESNGHENSVTDAVMRPKPGPSNSVAQENELIKGTQTSKNLQDGCEVQEVLLSDPETSSTSNNQSLSLKLEKLTSCCLAERNEEGKYICCHRPASGIPLSERLRELCVLKRFPFVYNCSKRHCYVCLYHRRLICLEPMLLRNETLKKRSLVKYEADVMPSEEERGEMQNDFVLMPLQLDDMLPKFRRSNAYCRGMEEKFQFDVKKKKTDEVMVDSESEESADEESDQPHRSARQAINNQVSSSASSTEKAGKKEKLKKTLKELKSFKYEEKADIVRIDTSTPFEVPMKILPANTLRRYKKAFQLPHRSGTNTKAQLLEGINEHLSSLQVPVHETIAQFLYTCKMRKNKLDFPSNIDTTDSIVGH